MLGPARKFNDVSQEFLNLGQSSTKVILTLNHLDQPVIVKSSPSSYLRLQKQFEKHLIAANGSMEPLRVPEVLSEYSNSEYTMSYSPGVPLGYFLATADHEETSFISDQIMKYFSNSLKSSFQNLDNPAKRAFSRRITDILSNLDVENLQLDFLQSLSKACLDTINRFNVPIGWNHGDFSFENLLIDENALTVTAIDFLDSPFDSIYLDIGRLWLDCNYGWWGAGISQTANEILNAKAIAKRLLHFVKEQDLELDILPLFAGFAIIRIFPYTKNPTRIAFLKNAAARIEGELL